MDAERIFWETLEEFGSLNFIEFIYEEITYQAVGNSDGSFWIYERDNENDEDTQEFYSIEDLLDKSSIEGKTFREIMHSPELKYFCFF